MVASSTHGGKGWGVVGGISTGAIVFVAVKQSTGFTTPELEEANACLFPIHQAWKLGYKRIIVEGGSSAIISKLNAHIKPITSLGFIFNTIWIFILCCDYIFFSHIAHFLAHFNHTLLATRNGVVMSWIILQL